MDRIDRRGFLECMAWAGTGLLWTATGGMPSSRIVSRAAAAEATGSFSFAQISDTHIGFRGQANGDPTATLQQLVERINALSPDRRSSSIRAIKHMARRRGPSTPSPSSSRV